MNFNFRGGDEERRLGCCCVLSLDDDDNALAATERPRPAVRAEAAARGWRAAICSERGERKREKRKGRREKLVETYFESLVVVEASEIFPVNPEKKNSQSFLSKAKRKLSISELLWSSGSSDSAWPTRGTLLCGETKWSCFTWGEKTRFRRRRNSKRSIIIQLPLPPPFLFSFTTSNPLSLFPSLPQKNIAAASPPSEARQESTSRPTHPFSARRAPRNSRSSTGKKSRSRHARWSSREPRRF